LDHILVVSDLRVDPRPDRAVLPDLWHGSFGGQEGISRAGEAVAGAEPGDPDQNAGGRA